MICPFCSHTSTKVTNSRPSKTMPRIWRRRFCTKCEHIVTTYERVSSKELPQVLHTNKSASPYSEARLMLSIWRELPETSASRADDAAALAETVTEQLILRPTSQLTSELIAQTTYRVVSAFQANSGARYGLTHSVITSSKLTSKPKTEKSKD